MATNATQPTRTPQRTAVGTGVAARFTGQPLVLHQRLNRALEELYFYKTSGRHHNERETSEVKTHSQHRQDAIELARVMADAIVAGGLEPEKPTADE